MAYKFAQYETLAANAAGGLKIHVHACEAWDENDPMVKNNPGLFGDEPPYVRTSGGKERIERATAAPGEKRRR